MIVFIPSRIKQLIVSISLCFHSSFCSFLVILSYLIQCSSDQEHTNISKKTSYVASKESFEIVSGSSVLFSSPPFSNNQQYVYEICLNTSSNHIFTLVMGDSSGTWSSGAWIEIEGMNGNIVYKGMMTEWS